MAEDVKYINKIDVTVPDESGDYTLSMWVTGENEPEDVVFMTAEYNTGGAGIVSDINDLLAANSFNPV
jgi:hypothetical protein